MEDPNTISNVLSSPSSEEPSVGHDYISSYTQISHAYDQSQHTDVESSDEFSEESNLKSLDKDTLPQLSSQIVEWTNKCSQVYDTETETRKDSESAFLDTNIQSYEQKLNFIDQSKLLKSIESHTKYLSKNLYSIIKFMTDCSSIITSRSVDLIALHEANTFETCDRVDVDIKLMYKIIVKCEELNKSLGFIDNLMLKIQEVKKILDTFENLIDKS